MSLGLTLTHNTIAKFFFAVKRNHLTAVRLSLKHTLGAVGVRADRARSLLALWGGQGSDLSTSSQAMRGRDLAGRDRCRVAQGRVKLMPRPVFVSNPPPRFLAGNLGRAAHTEARQVFDLPGPGKAAWRSLGRRRQRTSPTPWR